MRERARSRTQALEEPRAPELPESGTLRAERDELAKALRMTRFELDHVRAAELATGARCKIAEAALVSELRKNVDLLDQLRHAQDRAERALRPTREPVCSNRCQELEEQLRDLEILHTLVLQKFAEMTDSFVEVLCKSQTEVALWRHQSPGVSMEQELNELAEAQAENVRMGKDRVREELARGGINLPSSD